MSLKIQDSKKILIINQFGIGDVLFTMPLIDNIKLNFPSVSISYLCNSRVAPVLESKVNVDKIFVYDRDEWNDLYKKSKIKFLKNIIKFIGDIKKEEYDVVFDFSLNTTFNIITLISGIKKRIGFNYKKRSPFLTKKYKLLGFKDKHVVQFYLDLLSDLGLDIKSRQLEINIEENDNKWADNLIKSANFVENKAIIGVLPGAGESWGADAIYRRWPKENYVKLVDKMIEKLSAQIILMGDAKELNICEEIAKKHETSILQACGKTSLGQLAALLSRCDIVILNDGGPLHLAVSVGTKTVSIFGPVDENVYGPFGDKSKHIVVKSNISCRPCYRNFRMVKCNHISCLRKITEEDIFIEVKKLL